MFADQLLTFINDEISLDPSQPVERETDLLLTGLVDSLGVVEIVAWIEAELDVTIEPADVVIENFQTVDRMIGFVDKTFGIPA